MSKRLMNAYSAVHLSQLYKPQQLNILKLTMLIDSLTDYLHYSLINQTLLFIVCSQYSMLPQDSNMELIDLITSLISYHAQQTSLASSW